LTEQPPSIKDPKPAPLKTCQARRRTEQKVEYAHSMLQHLKESPSRATNDDWDNTVMEAFFYHLAGACEYLLHEINVEHTLGLSAGEVKWSTVKID